MSDTKSGPDWSKDWQALQRQYWNAWTDLTRTQAGAQPDPTTPWHEGLEQWGRMFGNAGKQSEAAERLMASAKSYLSLMQSMLSFAAGKDAGAIGTPSWLEALRGGMSFPGVDLSALGKIPGFDPAAFGKMPFDPAMFTSMPGFDASLLNNPIAKAMREISGQGVKGFEQLASGAAPFLQQFEKEGLSWLHVPAFGYAREHQEHYQKMALAFADFQEAVKHYNALILKSSQRSFEILELKLAERSEPGRQIDSMRALYDLWVDAAEEAYAEIALSEEFRKVYGDVVNSQMRVRSQLQQEVERIGADLGMPTRTELNSVHKRLHDLRRELRESREDAGASADDGRDAEMAALRAEVEELRRLVAKPAPALPPPKPVRSKAPSRRAPRALRAAAPKPAATPKVVAARPVKRVAARAAKPELARVTSFGDAIAAMRKDLKAAGKKKAKGAALSRPTRASKAVVRSRRGKS